MHTIKKFFFKFEIVYLSSLSILLYLCESAFSHMKIIKSNYNSTLTDDHLEANLRLAISSYCLDSIQCKLSDKHCDYKCIYLYCAIRFHAVMKGMLVVQWLLPYEMHIVTQIQNLDKAVCISYSAETLVKGMNPIFLSPTMGKC